MRSLRAHLELERTKRVVAIREKGNVLVHLQALRVQHLIQASFRLRIQRLHKTKAFAGGCLVCFILSKAQRLDSCNRGCLPEVKQTDVPTSTLAFTFLIRYIRGRTSIDVLALDCGGHHDVATAQTSQRLSKRLPAPATRHGVS